MTEAPTAREAIETTLRASAEEFARANKPRGCLIALGALHADEANEAVCQELRYLRATGGLSAAALPPEALTTLINA